VRCEVTSGQMLDLEAKFPQPRMRELDLSVFKGIFVTAAARLAFSDVVNQRTLCFDRQAISDPSQKPNGFRRIS
jgi:hypothetical protein